MYDIMTPGPTQVRENVRQARALACTNPDLDADFYDFYKETCEEISELLYTKNETLILDGEGILGLEAACATLTEKGDRVLVMDNGEYGKGFAGFVTMYGGEPVLYSTDYRNAFDVKALEKYLEKDHDFKYAALVHCDTPSGMLNDVSKLCPLLKKYGILTLVDSVSAMFGEEMRVDDYQIDLPERHRLHLFMQISWRLMAIMRSSGFHIQCPSVISMVCVRPLIILKMIRTC